MQAAFVSILHYPWAIPTHALARVRSYPPSDPTPLVGGRGPTGPTPLSDPTPSLARARVTRYSEPINDGSVLELTRRAVGNYLQPASSYPPPPALEATLIAVTVTRTLQFVEGMRADGRDV